MNFDGKETQTMETILETSAAVETVRLAFDGTSDRPRPEWVRGTCPDCGEQLVSNCYYVGGKGFLVIHECWASLGPAPTCRYKKVL